MRNIRKILKIVERNYPNIYFIANTGDYRVLNIKELYKEKGIRKGDFGYEVITDKEVFNKVTIVDHALAWQNLVKTLILPSGKEIDVFFHLDPEVAIEHSEYHYGFNKKLNIGRQLKSLRTHQNMSQSVLGEKVGTDKGYISKLENNKTDFEFNTLKKIYEVGLERPFILTHYDENDFYNSFPNSIFSNYFLEWASKVKQDLKLIEGIGKEVELLLAEEKIKTITDLSKTDFSDLASILIKSHPLEFYHYAESWIIQSQYLNRSDYYGLIKLQRNLGGKGTRETVSKLEEEAIKQLGGSIFEVE